MNKTQVQNFNQAYSYEPAEQEAQLINDTLAVWARLEPVAAKNPALLRKGVVFGMGLAAALAAGKITLPPVKEKTAGKRTQGEPLKPGTE